MNREMLLDALTSTLQSMYGGMDEFIVVRVDDGVLILVRGGDHILVRADHAELVVAS